MGLNRRSRVLQRRSAGIQTGLKVIADALDIVQTGAGDLCAREAETVLPGEPFVFLQREDMAAPVHPAQAIVQKPTSRV